MSNKKKFTVRCFKVNDVWRAEVYRNGTSRGSTLESSTDGFASKAGAEAWGLEETLRIKARRAEANRLENASRHGKRVQEGETRALAERSTFMELAQAGTEFSHFFLQRVENLWQQASFSGVKRGLSEGQAIEEANRLVGSSKKEHNSRALSGDLDRVSEALTRESIKRASFLAQVGAVMTGVEPVGAAASLVGAILALSGNKILTLVFGSEESFTVDLDENGTFGYHPSHRALFLVHLKGALSDGGGLTIRQFLTLRKEILTPKGQKMWIPVKKIYGVVLGGGKWHPLQAGEVADCFRQDPVTGEEIPLEDAVLFCDFPVQG